MLACEGYCLCGVDVAAPHQLRYGTKPLAQTLNLMKTQLVDSEVLLGLSRCCYYHMIASSDRQRAAVGSRQRKYTVHASAPLRNLVSAFLLLSWGDVAVAAAAVTRAG